MLSIIDEIIIVQLRWKKKCVDNFTFSLSNDSEGALIF